jgi:hypothetical protein
LDLKPAFLAVIAASVFNGSQVDRASASSRVTVSTLPPPQAGRATGEARCSLLRETLFFQARVIPFSGKFGPGLSPEDNQLLFQSVARLNAGEPSQVGRSEPWSAVENVFPGIFGPKCRENPRRLGDLGLFCAQNPAPC